MSFMLPYKFHAVHWRHSTAAAIFSTSGSWRSTSGRGDISRSWEHESLVPGKGCGATNVQTMHLPTQVKYKIEGVKKILGTSVYSVEDNTIQMQQGYSLQNKLPNADGKAEDPRETSSSVQDVQRHTAA